MLFGFKTSLRRFNEIFMSHSQHLSDNLSSPISTISSSSLITVIIRWAGLSSITSLFRRQSQGLTQEIIVPYVHYWLFRPKHPYRKIGDWHGHLQRQICDLEDPGNVEELRYFLGLCNSFYKFLSGLARIADELYRNLRKNQPQQFEELTNDEIPVMKRLK